MPKFRKRPVEIDAVRWTGSNLNEIATLIGPATNVFRKYSHLKIKTLEGTMICGKGDWLVKGVKGEFYPVRHDIFQQTYEPVAIDPNIIHPGSPDAPGPSPQEES